MRGQADVQLLRQRKEDLEHENEATSRARTRGPKSWGEPWVAYESDVDLHAYFFSLPPGDHTYIYI